MSTQTADRPERGRRDTSLHVSRNIRSLMAATSTTQSKLGLILGMSQPNVSNRKGRQR
jgi:hypothetical protein